MLHVSVLPIATGKVHSPNIVRMTQTRRKPSSDRMKVMWHPAPLSNLNTKSFLHQCWCNSVSHSDSLFFSIFAGSCFIPIPWKNIIVQFMNNVDCRDIWDPHSKGAITIYCVFLKISVHLIRIFIRKEWYCKIQNHGLSQLSDKYQAYWRGQDVRWTICKEFAV